MSPLATVRAESTEAGGASGPLPLPVGNHPTASVVPVYRLACRAFLLTGFLSGTVMWLFRAPYCCRLEDGDNLGLNFIVFLPQGDKTSEAAVKSKQFSLERDQAKGQRERR